MLLEIQPKGCGEENQRGLVKTSIGTPPVEGTFISFVLGTALTLYYSLLGFKGGKNPP